MNTFVSLAFAMALSIASLAQAQPRIAATDGNSKVLVQGGSIVVEQAPGAVPNPMPSVNSAPAARPAGQTYVNSDLSNRNFANAQLAGSKFTNVNLSGANLAGADLRNAQFVNVDLENADLRGANLQGASMVNVNTDGAMLNGAIWTHGRPCTDKC